MIDQVDSKTGSSVFKPLEASPPSLAQQRPGNGSNGLQFFGKDGFTFLDLLDVINPLQHIPIISTLYRSISGDTIDPGAKIVGGALFGGPIGAALSSLDVAVKHSTGRDIADHTGSFFVGTIDDQNTPAHSGTGAEISTLGPAQLRKQSNRGQAPVSVFQSIGAGVIPRTGELLKTAPPRTQVSEERYRAAGMSAIPIAKSSSGDDNEQPATTAKPLPDFGLLGDIARPSPPYDQIVASNSASTLAFSSQGLINETSKTRQNRPISLEPYRLEPKFSEADNRASLTKKGQTLPLTRPSPVTSLTPIDQPFDSIQAITQTNTDNRNRRILDAMRQGLNKYESTNRLATGSGQIRAVSVR